MSYALEISNSAQRELGTFFASSVTAPSMTLTTTGRQSPLSLLTIGGMCIDDHAGRLAQFGPTGSPSSVRC